MSAITTIRHAVHIGIDVQGFFAAMRRDHGDTFVVQMPGLNSVVFTSSSTQVAELFKFTPEAVTSSLPSPIQPLTGAQSLILMQGDAHTRERQQLKPMFQGQCLHQYSGYIEAAISEVCEQLDEQPGKVVNAQQLMQQVALDVILRAVFGVQNESQRRTFAVACQRLIKSYTPLIMLMPAARFTFLGVSPWDRFLRARSTLNGLIYNEIDARKRPAVGTDILTHMLQQFGHDEREHLRDELTTMLLAGFETTANTLTWALYYFATHTQWQDTVASQCGAVSEGSALTRMAMKCVELDVFCKEVMRLRPVVPLVIRSVIEPVEWAGRRMNVGTYAGVATLNLHMDESIYPQPTQFNPERFLDRKYGTHEYVPFGGGDKKCIGYGFALHEMKIILANLLRRFCIRLVKPCEPRAAIQGMALGPHKAINIKLVPRVASA